MTETTMLETSTTNRLDDKWTIDRGRVMMSGTQALARVLLAQKALDRRAGLRTAGYITGYRGSPLGNVDTALWSIAKRLQGADITFAPGVNEDMAATAVRGTQQLDAVPDPLYDGVFAAWYGKGPGVDRAGDALKHGNIAGAHRHGGVVVFYGDDHGGKSSTVAHHSEQAMAAAMIPSLYPASAGEIVQYGLMGYALSRYSGSWAGLKLVNEVVEQTAAFDLVLDAFSPILPIPEALPPEGVHIRVAAFGPLREEEIVNDYRLPLVQAFVRANGIDRTIFHAEAPRLGLVTAGKSYSDTRQALSLLGLDERAAAQLGISLYKVGCIWPLEPQGLAAFAVGHQTLFVIEEKAGFVEAQAAEILYNAPERPRLVGKRDEDGQSLLPTAAQLEPVRLALAIVDRLDRLGAGDPHLLRRAAELAGTLPSGPDADPALPRRTPYFCSGCPHSRSTRVPEGSLAMAGIGCHGMANLARPSETLPPTHMGGEGGNWMGLAPYTGTRHMFQNMGDGTYYHSGLLAIRAAVASGVNITYKVLYNDAVAMTGGQPVDGPISVAEIAHQVRHEGVQVIRLVTDNPDAYRSDPGLPAGVRIDHRDSLDAVQRELREEPGCSVLIYEQTCAAEKRRRRKRGSLADPAKRLFISKAVCEGCGDCSVQSTCVSLTPVTTDLGVKRQIDQSSCNKDYSCLKGFCPSFITVYDAGLRKPVGATLDEAMFASLPTPARAAAGDGGYNLMITGIGGTGVITVAAIIGMAAHLEGRAASLFDMTGLAQKNGAVFSHVRVADRPDQIHTQRIGRGETDVLIAFDLVASVAAECASTLGAGRTRSLVNSDVTPTVAFQFNRDASIDKRLLASRLRGMVGDAAVQSVDATSIATALLGDTIGANMFMVGVAAQSGLLPVGWQAVEEAIRLNGTAVAFNMNAFRLGRLWAAEPQKVTDLLPASPVEPPQTLKALVDRRVAHLTAYQDIKYANRYRALVERVAAAENTLAQGQDGLAMAVAHTYARLLSYKDEYEVARLLSAPDLKEELRKTFADGGRVAFNLAPPILNAKGPDGRPLKREFSASWMGRLFPVLAAAKGLRGTLFDPFGLTKERKQERALIAGYEDLVALVVGALTPDNHGSAVALLALADMVRGYGPVKEAAIAAYQAALPGARRDFLNVKDDRAAA